MRQALPAKEPQHARVRAFSLLELSIVLAIIGTLLAGAIAIGLGALDAKRYNATIDRMDAIHKTLLDYSTSFNRLPCPSSLTLADSDANFGVEGATPGTCTGGTPAANFTSSSGVVEGGVPTRTLRLPDEYQFDAWGRRFRYAVAPEKTVSGSLPVNTGFVCNMLNDPITVMGAAAGTRSTNAVYVLVSHGANGHGGYTRSGVVSNAGSTNVDEQTNCHCGAIAVGTTYEPTYVAKLPTENSASAVDRFDDIATFREAWQLETASPPVATPCTYMLIADYENNRIRAVEMSTGIISTIAGTGGTGFSGDGGLAAGATIHRPYDIILDSTGSFYISDGSNDVIRKINPITGIITTIAGTGNNAGYSGDGGPATSAKLRAPRGIAFDSSGNLFIAEYNNNIIRRVDASTGVITTYAGTSTAGYSGDGGPATSAQVYNPRDVAFDSNGDLFISDSQNHRIRKITTATGIITTVVGTGISGYSGDGGAAISAQLSGPRNIAIDSNDNIYIGDYGNHRVRKVTAATGIITTVAGTGTAGYSGDGSAAISAQLNGPWGVDMDSSGNLFISDNNNHRIRKVAAATGIITTVAGTGTAGHSGDGSAAISAQLNEPKSITFIGR